MRTREQIESDIERGSKVCTHCGERQDFRYFHVQSKSPDNYSGNCSDCSNDKQNKTRSQSKSKTAVQRRKYTLKKFGMTLQCYDKMLRDQNYSCAICGTKENIVHKKTARSFAVDHNHETGEVRGLLCNTCNRGLGLFKDNITVLESAAEYLKNNNKEEK